MIINKFGLGTQSLIALFLGILFGHFMPANVVWYLSPLAAIYLKLLKLMIVPLIFSSIVSSFAKYEDSVLMKKLGSNTLLWFIITALIASFVGLWVGVTSKIGVGIDIPNNYVNQLHNTPSIRDTFLNMIPSNIIGQIADGQVIPLIIFAIFVGLAISSQGEKVKTVRMFFSEFSDVLFKITRVIIKLSPIGIFAIIAEVSNKYGFNALIPLIKFIIVLYMACFIQIIVYCILLLLVAKKNPIIFIRDFFPAMITAFSTSTSMGTLPVTMERLIDNLKVRKEVVSFVAPLGANMKMDACGAIFPILVCTFTANILHIDLNLQQYILMFLLSSIATFCTVGMPGTAVMSATFVLTSMGFPLDGLAFVLGIDRILDMMRTMTNVVGTGTCALLVDKFTKSRNATYAK